MAHKPSITPFHQFLADEKTNVSQFAKRVPIGPSYMSEIANGRKKPSLEMACAISRATGRKLSAEYWLDHFKNLETGKWALPNSVAGSDKATNAEKESSHG